MIVAFHVHGLAKSYRSGEIDVQALRGIDLDIFESEILVLLGPSGSTGRLRERYFSAITI